MASNGNGVEFRDYIRVVFARGWWILFITLGVVGAMFYGSFHFASKSYVARNEILVTDKFSGPLVRDMGTGVNWSTRTRQVELDLKRSAPARGIIKDASDLVGVPLSPAEVDRMVENFKDDLKVVYSKEGIYISLEYRAKDGVLAAGVLSLFVKRMIASCVEAQVAELNNEVETLSAQRDRLAAEVARAEKRLDSMRTVAPELRLTAATMALLQSGERLTSMPSTEQAVAVFLELQRDIIKLDSTIADISEQIATVKRQIAREPETVPASRKLEEIPAVREAMRRRDDLRLQLARLLANSTAQHPHVRKIKTELQSLDAFLQSASTETTVEVVFEANRKRELLKAKASALESDLAGARERQIRMEENAESWRAKLDEMPAELMEIREATLDYEKKTENLSLVTGRLVQAEIKRSLQIDEVGRYYKPQEDPTKVPAKYDSPKHLLHLALGVVLGLVASVFVVYAMEFADHSVKDIRDMRPYTKAPVLGVISDYNQLKAVAVRAGLVKAAALKRYLLGALFVALAAALAWAYWSNMPRPMAVRKLPDSLSVASVSTIEQAMQMYSQPSDLSAYRSAKQPDLELVPAVEVPSGGLPAPALSE